MIRFKIWHVLCFTFIYIFFLFLFFNHFTQNGSKGLSSISKIAIKPEWTFECGTAFTYRLLTATLFNDNLDFSVRSFHFGFKIFVHLLSFGSSISIPKWNAWLIIIGRSLNSKMSAYAADIHTNYKWKSLCHRLKQLENTYYIGSMLCRSKDNVGDDDDDDD